MNHRLLIMLLIFVLSVLVVAGCSTNTTSQGNEGSTSKEAFPTKEIHLVIPFSAGSGADIFARKLAKLAEAELGQKIVAENKPGGSGSIALAYVLSQPADGYTIATHSRTFSFLLGGGEAPFELKDFDAVVRINGESSALMVNTEGQFKSLEDFVNYAKENPGKLKVGGPGTGSFHHMVAMLLMEKAGIEFTWIPYDGGKEAVLDLLGKNVDAVIATASNAKAQIDSGNIAVLANSVSETVSGIPTFKEKGYDIEEILWRGVFVKAGTPDERVKALEEAFSKAIQTQEWADYQKEFEQEDAFMSSSDFNPYLVNEVEKTMQFLQNINK
ncbi:tripartite tricarboxylate transporter substrate binding protein [Tepidibacillus infernus]|uniref:Transporter n=1 Tax=Tepidibacillus decaturensis TaxID=1413211 RepID=A0A135L6I6_9BACI|nr:tripartite tricarboxylate transporter substrate binding protein [Tepidibacillus decaturensis]KXG44586.1 hypothetical protein U473_11580 [Tepidibacillus decaturensis]